MEDHTLTEKRDLTTDENNRDSVGEASTSDEKLRLYLLGSLSEDERLILDERLLSDDELAARVELAESVLTDDYATGALNESERELFQRRFMVTEARRQNLRLSEGLRDYAPQGEPVIAVQQKPSWSERFAGLFAFDTPRSWAIAGSLSVLLLLIGLAWFAARQGQTGPSPIAGQAPIPTSSVESPPPTTGSPGQVVAGSQPSQPSPNAGVPNSSPTPEPVLPPTVASFVLLPGAMRSGGDMTRVAVPRGERDIVRLSLVLENPAEGSYRAELATAEGKTVQIRNNLTPTRNGHTKLVFSVSAQLLHTRDYQVKVARQKPDGQNESIGRYYFRAQQE